MTRAAQLPFALTLTLAAASCGDLQLTSSALAAPASAAAATPPSAPAALLDRLEQLDQLHADLELARLRAAIAKANREASEATANPAPLGPAGAPPLPQLVPGGAMLSLPAIPSPGLPAGKGKEKAKSESADAPPFTLVEAWGAGAERQAIIHSDAGDRLVRVGDAIAPGVVTAIGGGAVTYRDDRGRTHTID